jgi:hypothetical protein
MFTRLCLRRSRPNPLLASVIRSGETSSRSSQVAVATDLTVEIECREYADGKVLAPVAGVVRHPALSDVGRDLPVVGVNALEMAGAA